jgi:two-component system LytT family sensor kinase
MRELERLAGSGVRGSLPYWERLLEQTKIRLDHGASEHARRRATYRLIGAFWAFAILMLSVRALVIDALPISIMGPRRLAAAVIGAFLCLGMARFLVALRNRSFSARVVWGLIGAFVMAVILTSVTMTLNRIILPLPGFAPLNFPEYTQWTLVWFGYFLAWTGTHLALTYHWDSQDYQRRAALLAEMTREAQMAALRYQLNPHFLFNTLNSVSSLVGDTRNAEAETMLMNLATFVRSTLTTDPSGTIPLGEEIGLQRLYLDIEQVRFGERLEVRIDLPGDLAGVRMPALILQPVVENAVRHGVSRSEERLTIRISARNANGGIEVVVEDDGRAGPPVQPQSGRGGLGLANVRARLEAHYGEKGVLEAGPRPEGGYRAVLRLPRQDV